SDQSFVGNGGVTAVGSGDTIYVYAIDRAGVLREAASRVGVGGTWTPGNPLYPASSGPGFVPGGDLAAVALAPEHIFVLTVALDGLLWVAEKTGGQWAALRQVHEPVHGGRFRPGRGLAAVPFNGHICTFAIGDSGSVWSMGEYDGTSWRGGDWFWDPLDAGI